GNIIAPQLKLNAVRGSTGAGVPLAGNEGGSDVGEDAFVPVLYAMWDIQRSFGLEENIKLGVGVNVPFGLETDYRDNWIGRYYALHSKVRTINVNPALAWEPLEGLAVAAGVQAQYIDARLTNAIDFGTIGAAFGGTPGQNDGLGKVDGHDLGWGYNLGLLWEPWTGTRLGIAWRSAIEHTLHGDGNFTLDAAGVGARVQAATGLFQDGGMQSDLTTPETLSFGVHHDIDAQWSVMGEAQWTRWSRFHELKIEFDNPAQPDSITEQEWRDTWFVALGATFRPDEAWTLRGGVAWDQDPTSDSRRTPRIPTDNRYWLSFGAGWKPLPGLTLDAGYTHIFLKNSSIDLAAGDRGNRLRGNLSAQVEGAVDIIALQARWVF
ncbi:MAG TPA: outer membrane protein transport protein, partial [Rhodospirillales bacterium]|nr:outer membrane protein transport protein [Rhodospirillales bacterium]